MNAGGMRAIIAVGLDCGQLPVYHGLRDASLSDGVAMKVIGCGEEMAARAFADFLASWGGWLPPDIALYRRAAVRLLAKVPPERVDAVMRRLAAVGGLPSRAEIAAACGA